MQKTLTQLEWKIGEKSYSFTCEPDSPTQDAKEALFQFIKYIGSVEDYWKAKKAEEAAQMPIQDDCVKSDKIVEIYPTEAAE